MVIKPSPTVATRPPHHKPRATKGLCDHQAPAPEPLGVPMPLIDGPEGTIEGFLEEWDAMTDEERENWGGPRA